MKCDLPIELLSSYLDGELDREQTRMVEEHLKACKVCRNELEELKQLDGYVRTVEVEEPSREFIFTMNRRVIDSIKKRQRVSFFRFAPVLVPVAVAALVLIVLIRIPERTQFVDIDHLVRFTETETRHEDTTVKPPVDERMVVAEKAAPERDKGPVRTMKDGGVEEYTAAGAPAASPPEPVMKKAAVSQTRREAEVFEVSEDADIADIEGLLNQYAVPKGQVVRAIVDTTGRVIKVATGNTIIPERDTVLENRLEGQQLARDRFKGKRVQYYLDFINEAAEEETTGQCTE